MSRLVDVFPQRVYGSVPLLLPLIKTSEAEAIWLNGQPQIYDKNYPLDHSGLNFSPPWWADTGVGGGLNGVGGGNVALLPHEMAGLGAVRRGRSAPVPVNKKSTAGNKTVPPATSRTVAKGQACTAAGGLWNSGTNKCTTKAQQDAAALAALVAACKASGGVWNASKRSCGPSAAQSKCAADGGLWSNGACAPSAAQSACATGGGKWSNGACISSKAQQTCESSGDTWSNGACVQSAAHNACATGGGKWSNGACIPAKCPTGQSWDATQFQCLPGKAPDPQTCPVVSVNCPTGQMPSYGTYPDCKNTCIPDPNYQDPQISQCQSTGGYWNGSMCIPPQPQPTYGGGGGGGMSPPSMGPGPDSGSGSGTQPQSPGYDSGYSPTQNPMQQQQGYGMSMQQGDGGGGQFDEQAFNIPTQEEEQADKKDDDGVKDSSAGVASSNIFESISKLFSGMGGTACGVNSVPPWFGMSGTKSGGNAPPLELIQPRYYEARGIDPIKSSTVTGVIGGSAVLVAIGAAVYFWSKSKK